MMRNAHPRFWLQQMDGTIRCGMSANQIRMDSHCQLHIIFTGREGVHTRGDISVQSIAGWLIDGTPQGAIFLQRIHRPANIFLEQWNNLFRFPAAHFAKP